MRTQILAPAVLLALLLPCKQVLAEEHTPPRSVTVTGEGVVSAVPDMATVTTGVETEAPDAQQALASNNAAMAALLGAVEKHGVDAKDVQTSAFRVTPVYRRGQSDASGPRIEGYQVANQVSIRVRDVQSLGTLLQAVVEAGGNRLSGIQFGHQDMDGLLDQARRLAVADARHRAELYAGAAGVGLGEVLSISEGGAATPLPMLRTVAMAEAAAVPVAAGEDDVRATVQVVYALD